MKRVKSLKEPRKLMGHADVKTTAIYDQRSEKAKKETVDQHFN